MKISQDGIDLIKHFEGLVLKAYPDPGTGGEPYTIGYGHTGGVRPGQTITAEQAEEFLVKDLERFERAVGELITVPLTQGEFDALVSFTFNVGEGALEGSTLRRRLNAGGGAEVFEEELPRWNKGGNGVMPGLVRRRAAEVELATRSPSEAPESFLERAAAYYVAEPHQTAAWRALEASLTDEQLEAFKTAFRGKMIEHTPEADKFPLDVPYFYQRDSRTGQGERMCFSSSMAMALDYIAPEVIDGDDDWYLEIVNYFGDSTSSEAQVRAARSLGFSASFHMDGTIEDLEDLLDNDIPVPIGVLHKGPVTNPTGGGHWVCLVGHNETEFIVHDPFGQMDLVNGGYVATGPEDGMFQHYTKKNLMKRWNIANDHDGWYVDLS